ncbi:MAG: hypothetical protein HFJ11_05585 [Bacilli bacterium]|nr:hypothetical protein [Bacilli bacterium]
MLDRLYDYVSDNEFRFTVFENKFNVLNYKRILSLEDNYISILSNDKKITIIGDNFVLNKLVKDELLVTGNITRIEVVNE